LVVAALRGEDTGPITFDVDSVRKDLQTMVEEAQALGRTLPVVERALECFDQASHEGWGKGLRDAIGGGPSALRNRKSGQTCHRLFDFQSSSFYSFTRLHDIVLHEFAELLGRIDHDFCGLC
jgi:hypothetical protein